MNIGKTTAVESVPPPPPVHVSHDTPKEPVSRDTRSQPMTGDGI